MHKILLDEGEANEFLNIEHIPIKNSTSHPQYGNANNEGFHMPQFDFLILKLEWASQLYADQIIDLDTPTDDYGVNPGDRLVTMGLGRTANSFDSHPKVLQEGTLEYVTNARCDEAWESWEDPPDSTFCTTSGGEVEPCWVIMLSFSLLKLVICFFRCNLICEYSSLFTHRVT